jgi:hypothetical protein
MKNIQKRLFLLVYLWASAVIFSGCKKDFEQFNWDTDLSFPVAYGRLTLGNLLADSILENNNGNLSLKLKQDLVKVDIEKLIDIPDTLIDSLYSYPINLYFDPGYVYFNKVEKTKLNLSGAQITNAVIKKGKIIFSLSTTLKERSILNFKMNGASKNGVLLTFTDWVEKSDGITPVIYTKEIDLSGYTLNLKGVSNNSFNEIFYQITAQTDPNGQPVIFEAGNFMKFETQFKDLAPEYLMGYFGNLKSNIGPESINLDIFKKIKSGFINLDDAFLNLSLTNRIGTDIKLNIKEITSYNSNFNKEINLENSELINNTITVNRATQTNTGPYPPVVPFIKNYTLTSANSNIKTFIENLPTSIGYNLGFELNPFGNLSGGNDFVYFDKPFEAKMELTLPLKFNLNNLILADTIKFKKTIAGIDRTKSATVSISLKNNFPFSVNVLLYTMDSLGNFNTLPIEPEKEIKSATTDNSGNILNASEQELVFKLINTDLKNILNKGNIYITARANSPLNSKTILTEQCFIEYKTKLQVILNTRIGK